jgi:hypothetical protein
VGASRRGVAVGSLIMAGKTSAKRPPETAPPEDTPLSTYLGYVREGVPDATPVERQFWIGSLTEGGRSVSLYAKTQQEIERQARALLAARGSSAN